MITQGILEPDPAAWRLTDEAVQVDEDPAPTTVRRRDPFSDFDESWRPVNGRGWRPLDVGGGL